MNTEYDVFLCHNSDDKDVVKEISDVLELEDGMLFFLDAVTIPPSIEFEPFIRQELSKSRSCAVFLGANGWGETHLWEARQALQIYEQGSIPGFRFIPVLLPGATEESWTRLFSDGVVKFNWVDLRNLQRSEIKGSAPNIEKLRIAIREQLEGRARGSAQLTPFMIRRQAAQWEKAVKDREETHSLLFTGALLREAERLVEEETDAFATMKVNVTAFLTASTRLERRRLRIRTTVTAVIGLFLVALAVSGFLVERQRARANFENRRALAEATASTARMQVATRPDAALAYAAEAYSLMELPQTKAVLFEALASRPSLRWTFSESFNSLLHFGTTADESTLVALDSGSMLYRFDARTFEPNVDILDVTKDLRGCTATAMAIHPERPLVAVTDGCGNLHLVSLLSGRIHSRGASRDAGLESVVFDSSGTVLALGTSNGRIILKGLAGVGDQVETFPLLKFDAGHTHSVRSLDFSPGGVLISNGWDNVVRLWDLDPEGLKASAPALVGLFRDLIGNTPEGDPPPLIDAVEVASGEGRGTSFSAGGSYYGFRSNDEAVIVSVASEAPEPHFKHGRRGVHVSDLAFSPDDRYAAVSFRNGLADLIDLDARQVVNTFAGYADEVHGLTFSSDSASLLTVGDGNVLRLWAVSQPHALAQSFEPDVPQSALALDHSGSLLAVLAAGNARGTEEAVTLWDIRDKSQPQRLAIPNFTGLEFQPTRIALSPTGQHMTVASDQELVLMDVETGGQLKLTDHVRITALAFSRDGQRLAVAHDDYEVTIYGVDDLSAPLDRFVIPTSELDERYGDQVPGGITSLSFNADDTLLALGHAFGEVLVRNLRHSIWNGEDTAAFAHRPLVHSYSLVMPTYVAFHADQTLATGSGFEAQLVAGDAREVRSALAAFPEHVSCLQGSPTAELMILCLEASGTGSNAQIVVFDAASATYFEPPLTYQDTAIWVSALSGDGKVLVTNGAGESLLIWTLDPAVWVNLAQEFSSFEISPVEREQYNLALEEQTWWDIVLGLFKR